MGWTVKFETATVDFDDLSPDAFAKIATEDDEANWWGVYKFPGGNPARLYRVIVACAEHAGVEPPPEPGNMREATALLNMLGEEQKIEDRPVVDGLPQVPTVPENGSISGALGDSDGPEQLLEPSPSVSS